MLKKKIVLLFSALFLLACTSGDIIPAKRMVPILAKIYLTDAMLANSNHQLQHKDSIEYYASIIKSYGYTSAQFDSSINYYSSKPSELDAIMDKVIFELSRVQSDLEQEERAKDSLSIDTLKNHWNLKPFYELKLDMPNDIISFDIPVVGLGIYSFSYNIQIFPDDETVKPQLKVYFYYDDKSKEGNISQYTEIPYIKDGVSRTFTTSLELKNSLVTNLRGYLLDYNNTDQKYKNHAIISDIKLKYKPYISLKRNFERKEDLKVRKKTELQ